MDNMIEEVLRKLIVNARNNVDHEASYDLINIVSCSDEVQVFLKPLIEEGLIEVTSVYGHSSFNCIVTEKGMTYYNEERGNN